MATFYLTLLYFIIFLFLNRFEYIKLSNSLIQVPEYLIILGFLVYMILSLINIIFYEQDNKYKVKVKLGYLEKIDKDIVINIGAGILPIIILLYYYPRSALVPLAIALLLSTSIGLSFYRRKKNIYNKLPVFSGLIISIFTALFLSPSNPVYLMISVFVMSSLILLLINILFLRKKTPLYIGEQNFYHMLFVLLLFSLII